MTTRLLKENEYLLGKQQVKGTQKVSKKALAEYYQQRPNTTWLGIPWRLWSYHLGQRSFDQEVIQQRIAQLEGDFAAKIALAAGDPKKVQRLEKKRDKKIQAQTKLLTEGNALMRWGEAPVLYSPQQRKLTEQNLLNYLQAKGYFDAHVSSTIKLRDQKAVITYHVQENQPHLIGAIRLNTPDQAIEKLLQAHQQQSLLKKGTPYDQEVLEQERERIYELLSNHGYFNFDRQYIWFNVDKAGANSSVIIETVVGVPADRQTHPVYHIDQVIWDLNADQDQEKPVYYGGVTFKNLYPQVKPHILANNLGISLPQLYKKQDLIDIQQRLGSLGMFKYINISYELVDPSRLVPHIHTIPVDRFELTHELGFQTSQWLPMPFYRLSIASKNILGRLETLKLGASLGIEGASASTNEKVFASGQGGGIDLSLSWPQFLLPFSNAVQAHLTRFNPRTKLSIGYDFSQRTAYTQDTFKSYWGYAWQGQSYGAYEWIPFRMDWLATREMSEEFKGHLEDLKRQGNSLYRSFQSSWLMLFSFKGIFQKKPISKEDLSYSALELFLESGGFMQNFIDLRRLMPTLVYYQYVKFNCTYSQHLPVRPGTIFAYRINTGIANPYGEEKVLPYSRYYFVGGANDMRAWLPRSLGPGFYSPSKSANDKQRHQEQPGELLLQGSIELRQQLLDFWEGALFVDVGNTWTLYEDGRPGGKFSFQDFYKAMAVGAGLGLRLNFRFLVLRLDLGIKLYDPSRPVGERFVGHKLAPDQAVFNFGIGYPF